MPKRLAAMLFFFLLLCGCGGRKEPDYLAYQRRALILDVCYLMDGEEIGAHIELDAPAYDEDGRMLSRTARLTLGEGILSGIVFDFAGDGIYIQSGPLKIPLADTALQAGIADLISLFCIDEASFYEVRREDGTTEVIYKNGEDEVILRPGEDGMPSRIHARLGGREIAVRIESAEFAGDL